jgi:hypothetical protein
MSASAKLLTRDEFRTATLKRVGGRCCVSGCDQEAVDAHHIVERRLFPDGGYYADNGAPLCSGHHLEAERTTISPDDLRQWLGIKHSVLPPQFEDEERIDKWGNPVLPNGTRLKGELFDQEPVQKALTEGGVIHLFRDHVKYPKTWHLPSSPGFGRGDRLIPNTDEFEGKRVIVTEKRDGECTSLYRDHMHARSLDGRHHPSRDWLKGFWGAIRYDVPEGWRVCGENVYARHSIGYTRLPSWFEGFSVWNDANQCLSWDETIEWFSMIGSGAGMSITPVPVIYDGPFDLKAIDAAWKGVLDRDAAHAAENGEPLQEREGYVVRLADGFAYKDFRKSVAKWVRKNHVQTDAHWMHGPVVANGLQERNVGFGQSDDSTLPNAP